MKLGMWDVMGLFGKRLFAHEVTRIEDRQKNSASADHEHLACDNRQASPAAVCATTTSYYSECRVHEQQTELKERGECMMQLWIYVTYSMKESTLI